MNESEKTPSNITPFYFLDDQTPDAIKLTEACWINGKPYFTRRAIGEFLGYSQPLNAINWIIKRNPHINDLAWSTNVKLTLVEGDRIVERDTRVYDLVALQLILNKSNQPRAIAFQVAVALLVVDFLNDDLDKFCIDAPLSSSARNIHNFCHMVASISSVARRNRMVLSCAAYNNIKASKVCTMIHKNTGVSLSIPRQTTRKFHDEYATAMAYHQDHPLSGGLCIKRTLGLTASERTINQWIREAMLCAA